MSTTREAFGIAASMASGLQRNFGTMTKPLHTGLAARSALPRVQSGAQRLHRGAGHPGSPAGFFAAYGVDESSAEAAVERLGDPW